MSATSSGRFAIIPARAVDELDNAAIAVLAALGCYANRDGYCWPSVRVLAQRLRTTRQAVIRQTKVLQERGFIEVSRRKAERGGTIPNAYRLLFDADQSRAIDGLTAPKGGGNVMLPGEEHGVTGGVTWAPSHNKEEHPKRTIDRDAGFTEFLALYPACSPPANPKVVRTRFNAALKSGAELRDLIEGAKNYRAYAEVSATKPQFVKQPHNWLRDEAWAQFQRPPAPRRTAVGMC